MAESKIKTFLSLGSLQREILEEARRYECFGQALEHDAYHHHEGDRVHAEYIRISV